MTQLDTRAVWGAGAFRNHIPNWAPFHPFGIAYHDIGAVNSSFNPAQHAECLGWVRGTELSEETPGVHPWVYSAIAYNFCICPHGIIIEGRGLDFQSGAQEGGNDSYIGVLFMRDPGDPVTAAMELAAVSLRSMVLSKYPQATQEVGHKDVAGNPSGTQCPSDLVEAWVHAGAARMAAQRLKQQPTASTEDDMQVAISPYPGNPSGRAAIAYIPPGQNFVMLDNGARCVGDKATQDPRIHVWVPPVGNGKLVSVVTNGKTLIAIADDPQFGKPTFATAWAKP